MKSRKVIVPLVIALAAALLLIGILVPIAGWTSKKAIAPSGGRYFFHRVELAVPQLFQGDEKWSDDYLAATDGTIGEQGCAIASIAMIFRFYGIDTDPQRLNWFLDGNGGYTPEGWVYWEKAAAMAPPRPRETHLRRPPLLLPHRLKSHARKPGDRETEITERRHALRGHHGKGWVGLPHPRPRLPGGVKGIYPLKELGSDILGLRFYEPLAKK